MTKITLKYDPEGMILGFECRGHSGYSQEGSDIVCAAVSALSIACSNSLVTVAGCTPSVHEKDAYLSVSVSPQDMNHDTQVIFRVFEQGIQDIVHAYPQYISLTKR
jgi:hypothetical protein